MSTDELVKAHQEWIDACEKTGNVNSRTYELSKLSITKIARLSEALAKAEGERDWEESARKLMQSDRDQWAARFAASEAARERLAALLSDCVAIMRGDLVGSSQIDGVLREATAVLASAPAIAPTKTQEKRAFGRDTPKQKENEDGNLD